MRLEIRFYLFDSQRVGIALRFAGGRTTRFLGFHRRTETDRRRQLLYDNTPKTDAIQTTNATSR